MALQKTTKRRPTPMNAVWNEYPFTCPVCKRNWAISTSGSAATTAPGSARNVGTRFCSEPCATLARSSACPPSRAATPAMPRWASAAPWSTPSATSSTTAARRSTGLQADPVSQARSADNEHGPRHRQVGHATNVLSAAPLQGTSSLQRCSAHNRERSSKPQKGVRGACCV